MAPVAASVTLSTAIPADYAELYEHYIALVVSTVVRGGIHRQDADDIAHEILTRIIARDLLASYDPHLRHDTPQGLRTAKFSTWLAATVKRYLPHFRDRQNLRDHREGLSLTLLIEDDYSDQLTTTEGRSVGQVTTTMTIPDHADAIAEADRLGDVVTALDDVEVRGTRDLAKAMRCMAELVERHGEVSRRRLALAMGVSTSTAHNIMCDVQEELLRRGLTPTAIASARANERCYEMA